MTTESLRRRRGADGEGPSASKADDVADTGDDAGPRSTEEKRAVTASQKMKPMPSLVEMLREGAPEDRGREKTTLEHSWDVLCGPVLLAAVFLLSLLLFHYAPHDKSVGKKHVIPTIHRIQDATSRAGLNLEHISMIKRSEEDSDEEGSD